MRTLALLALSAALAGCTAASVLDGADPVEEAGPFEFAHRHEFSGAPERVPFVVPEETPAWLQTWFDGAFVNAAPLSIELVAPDGRVVAASSTPPSHSGGRAGERTFHTTREIVLTPGEWALRFDGQGEPFGVAVITER